MLGIYADIASHFSTSLQPLCSRHASSLIPPSGVVGQLIAGAVASCMADVSLGTLGSQPLQNRHCVPPTVPHSSHARENAFNVSALKHFTFVSPAGHSRTSLGRSLWYRCVQCLDRCRALKGAMALLLLGLGRAFVEEPILWATSSGNPSLSIRPSAAS